MRTNVRHRSRSLLLIAAIVCSWVGSIAQAASLPVLTTSKQVHSLPLDEATRHYPVRLKAVVTYYDPYIDVRHPALFVHDNTGSVFVALVVTPKEALQAGDLLEITGISAPGDYAPIVGQASFRVVGKSHVPVAAEPVTMSKLLTGAFDGHWVQVEGIVRSVTAAGEDLNLEIATSDGPILATALRSTAADASRLIDSQIRIHANAAPVFNRHLQLTGVRLFFPAMSAIQVVKPGTSDPFVLPVLPIDELLRFSPNITYIHLVHVQGRVTLQWPGRTLCIENAGQGICAQTREVDPVAEGSFVDLAGFPAIGALAPTLTDAFYRVAGKAQQERPTPITSQRALAGEYDAKLVKIEGTLIGKDRVAKDPTMILRSGKLLFPAVIPSGSRGAGGPDWEEGSTIQVTGICSVVTDAMVTEGFSTPTSFRILMRNSNDVVVLARPSWWTPRHLLPILIAVLAITLGVLGWVIVLRQRVAAQTAVIRNQNTILRELSFQDGLTRLANRRKFDETLQLELERAERKGIPLSLLMLDIDNFKALNDEYGHQRGDECLTRVARALESASRRQTDLVARYGGEEFTVILPKCDEVQSHAIAERMRVAVRDLAIPNSRSPFGGVVSISIGAATSDPGTHAGPASLIALADKALYESKMLGRNRITLAGSIENEKSLLNQFD